MQVAHPSSVTCGSSPPDVLWDFASVLAANAGADHALVLSSPSHYGRVQFGFKCRWRPCGDPWSGGVAHLASGAGDEARVAPPALPALNLLVVHTADARAWNPWALYRSVEWGHAVPAGGAAVDGG